MRFSGFSYIQVIMVLQLVSNLMNVAMLAKQESILLHGSKDPAFVVSTSSEVEENLASWNEFSFMAAAIRLLIS